MENSSSGGQQGRPNRQGSRGGRNNQRRRSNRGSSNSRQRGEGNRDRNRNRNRQGEGNRGPRRAPEKPSLGKRILSVLTFGLVDASSGSPQKGKRPQRSGRPEGGNRNRPERSESRGDSSRKKRVSRKPERLPVTSGRLYVGNLDYNASEHDLENLFNEVGTVVSAEVVTNPRTHQSKGFAFVEMSDVAEAKRAAEELHDRDFMGRMMLVSGAKSSGPREGDQEGPQDRRDRPAPSERRERRPRDREEPKPPPARKPKESLPVTSTRLQVGNLDYNANEADLEDLFRGVGTVASAEVVTDSHTQQSKGMAIVEMSHIDEAKRAVEILHDKDFMGRKLLISGAPEESDAPEAEESAAPQAEESEASKSEEPSSPEPEESDAPEADESTAPLADESKGSESEKLSSPEPEESAPPVAEESSALREPEEPAAPESEESAAPKSEGDAPVSEDPDTVEDSEETVVA